LGGLDPGETNDMHSGQVLLGLSFASLVVSSSITSSVDIM